MRSIRIGSPEINVNDKLQIPIYCSNAGSGRNFRFRMSFTGSTDAMSVMESYSFTTPVSATSPGDSYSTIEDRLGINLGPNVMPSATLTVDGNMALDAGTTIIDS